MWVRNSWLQLFVERRALQPDKVLSIRDNKPPADITAPTRTDILTKSAEVLKGNGLFIFLS
jgi:hypothetical protein